MRKKIQARLLAIWLDWVLMRAYALAVALLFCTFGIGKFGRGFAQRKQFTLNAIASESSHNSGTEFADLK